MLVDLLKLWQWLDGCAEKEAVIDKAKCRTLKKCRFSRVFVHFSLILALSLLFIYIFYITREDMYICIVLHVDDDDGAGVVVIVAVVMLASNDAIFDCHTCYT